MDRGKGPLLLPYTRSSSSVGLLLHLQYYQRCESMIFKVSGNVNLFWGNRVLIIYSLKKRIRKFTFLKCSFFWRSTVTVNLNKFSSITIFRWFTFGKFYIAKFCYFSGRHNKVKEMFSKIFDWPLCWWY